jgi:hypothetical protein
MKSFSIFLLVIFFYTGCTSSGNINLANNDIKVAGGNGYFIIQNKNGEIVLRNSVNGESKKLPTNRYILLIILKCISYFLKIFSIECSYI